MNSKLGGSRENILNQDELQLMSNSQVYSVENINKPTNRITSAVANTRQASNRLHVASSGQYPVTMPNDVPLFDEFAASVNSTFVAENTIQKNLTEDQIIDGLANSVDKNGKPALAPLKQSRNLNNKLDKLPTDNDSKEPLPLKPLAKLDPISSRNGKIPPIMNPISVPPPTTGEPRQLPPPRNAPKPATEVTLSLSESALAQMETFGDRKQVQNGKPSNLTSLASVPPVSTVAEKKSDYVQVKTDKNKMKYIWLSFCLILVILIILLAIILGIVLGNRSKSVAQMAYMIIINTTNITNTTTSTTSTSTTSTTSTTTAQWCQYTTTQSQTQVQSQSYTCPNNTPYVSQYLTLTNWYSYGYVINQQIACSGSIVNLVCPINQYIHIYSAYFGIQSATPSSCLTLSALSPTNCFSKAAFTAINSTCEYKNNCSIIATVGQLGNPCYGSTPQLLVQYQCLDMNTATILNQCPFNSNTSSACSTPTDPTVQTQYWCEPSLMQISCTGGNVIQIVCAYYGIDSTYQCPGGNYIGAPTSCYANSAKQQVITTCNGRTSCLIIGNPNYQTSGFIDPCYGFSKILYVQYKCISLSSLTTTTSTLSPSTTTGLPYCVNNVVPSGSCSSIASSPFVPTFLTANQTSFGYPISQEVVCLGSQVSLTCPSNSVIHIYSAYFGIQSSTSWSSCFLTASEQPAQCYYKSAFSYINSTCEYQQSCSISASTAIFSDACPSFIQKQLFIQYQCVGSYALNTTINQCNSVNTTTPLICAATSVANSFNQTWCTGSTLNITCSSNKTINILCAYYGLHPSLGSSCNISSLSTDVPVCYFKSSFTYVQTMCNNQTNCAFAVNSTNFPDPCNGQTKGLFVQWSCN